MDWTAAVDQYGIVPQSALMGLEPEDIRRLVRDKELTRLDRGWFCVGVPSSDDERHRLATRAMIRSHEGRAVASYHSALLLLKTPTFRADLDVVRLSRLTAGAPRTRARLRLGRAVPAELVRGVTVHPALAAVQCGVSAGPLAALVAASGVLHAGLASAQDLDDVLDFAAQHPKVHTVAPFLALADARHASAGETRVAHALHLMKVPAIPQWEVRDEGFLAYADFGLRDERVLLEFDGRSKYGRTADEVDFFGRKVAPGEIVWMEKQREDRLRELGFEVVRITWSELDDLQALARKIRAAIDRARARRAA